VTQASTRHSPYDGDRMRPPGPDEVWEPGTAPFDSHFRRHNDWFEDPWAAPEVKARRKRERHARWTASISEHDWVRLRDRAGLVLGGQSFARFMDLDAVIDVAVCHLRDRLPNGDQFGELRGCPLLAFPKQGK
jgi:hypothetical protein